MDKVTFTPLSPAQFLDKYLTEKEYTRDWMEWALSMYAKHCCLCRDFTQAHEIVNEIFNKLALQNTDNVPTNYWCEICTYISNEPGPCQNCGHKTR